MLVVVVVVDVTVLVEVVVVVVDWPNKTREYHCIAGAGVIFGGLLITPTT